MIFRQLRTYVVARVRNFRDIKDGCCVYSLSLSVWIHRSSIYVHAHYLLPLCDSHACHAPFLFIHQSPPFPLVYYIGEILVIYILINYYYYFSIHIKKFLKKFIHMNYLSIFLTVTKLSQGKRVVCQSNSEINILYMVHSDNVPRQIQGSLPLQFRTNSACHYIYYFKGCKRNMISLGDFFKKKKKKYKSKGPYVVNMKMFFFPQIHCHILN